MSKRKKPFYVVFRGVKPGIYTVWANCLKQVDGFPNNKFKGYATLEEAASAWKGRFD